MNPNPRQCLNSDGSPKRKMNLGAAERAAAHRNENRRRHEREWSAYECEFCRFYHIGHTPAAKAG